MSKAQHTPGPWTWHTGQGGTVVRGGQSNVIIAGVGGGTSTYDNARLISASPDLLAACEAVLKHIHDNGEDSTLNRYEFIDTLRAAIAKAKGTA